MDRNTYARAWYHANKTKINARRRRPKTEAEKEYMRQWRGEHTEQFHVAMRAWGQRRRGHKTAMNAIRKQHIARATPHWLTKGHWTEIIGWYDEAHITGMHVDHIVPLRGKTVCGLHVPWNLQLLSPIDNLSKGNKLNV